MLRWYAPERLDQDRDQFVGAVAASAAIVGFHPSSPCHDGNGPFAAGARLGYARSRRVVSCWTASGIFVPAE